MKSKSNKMEKAPRPNLVGSPKMDFQSSASVNVKLVKTVKFNGIQQD
jgi:hypothetical protein